MRKFKGIEVDENEVRIEEYKDNHISYTKQLKIRIFDKNNNIIYSEYYYGSWVKHKYDKNGNQIYREDSDGDWIKWKYDGCDNKISYEDSDGDWWKYESGEYGITNLVVGRRPK